MRHFAVVGSGPAGFYTAEALEKAYGDQARIDILDRYPVPYGLIRFGVAPDHQSLKAVAKRYDKVAETETVRFVGNVTIGSRAVMATALAAPMVEPPPIASNRSAPAAAAAARAASAVGSGTCSRTSVNVPTTRPPSGASSAATRSASRVEAIASTRRAPSRSISGPIAVRAASTPKTTRWGSWS